MNIVLSILLIIMSILAIVMSFKWMLQKIDYMALWSYIIKKGIIPERSELEDEVMYVLKHMYKENNSAKKGGKLMNNLKELRESKGLSQAELAEKIGFSQQMVGHFEIGLRSPNANTILLICQALSCTPNDLLGFSKKEQ